MSHVATSSPVSPPWWRVPPRPRNAAARATGSRAARGATDRLRPPAAVLLAAGDIASCRRKRGGDRHTADLLARHAGTIAMLGDGTQNQGTTQEHAVCYHQTWGSHKARTMPAVGNHEYKTHAAAPYWHYWGDTAGARGKGWYSFVLGGWRVVVLNSNCRPLAAGGERARGVVARAAGRHRTLHAGLLPSSPLGSANPDGADDQVLPFWEALYAHGADVILNGHRHNYERFAPQDPQGNADPHGITQFVVGTGGYSHHPFRHQRPHSVARNDETFGILKLALGDGAYAWEFLPVAGQTFRTGGAASVTAHGADAGPSPLRRRALAAPSQQVCLVSGLGDGAGARDRTVRGPRHAKSYLNAEAITRIVREHVVPNGQDVAIMRWIPRQSDGCQCRWRLGMGPFRRREVLTHRAQGQHRHERLHGAVPQLAHRRVRKAVKFGASGLSLRHGIVVQLAAELGDDRLGRSRHRGKHGCGFHITFPVRATPHTDDVHCAALGAALAAVAAARAAFHGVDGGQQSLDGNRDGRRTGQQAHPFRLI